MTSSTEIPQEFINDLQWEDFLRYEFELLAYQASLEDVLMLDLDDDEDD